MKKTRKSYADLYIEGFADAEEFIATLEERKGVDTGLHCYGVSSWEEAYKDLRGEGKGFDDLEERFALYLAGLEAMTEKRQKEGQKEGGETAKRCPKGRDIEFLFVADEADESDGEATYMGIRERRLSQLAGIALLEKNYGCRCSVSLACPAYEGEPREGKTNVACLIRLKSLKEPFSLKKLSCLPLKPNSLTALLSRWEKSVGHSSGLNREYESYHCNRPYGRRNSGALNWEFKRKMEFFDLIKDENSSLICLECADKIEDVLKRLTTPILVGRKSVSTRCFKNYGVLDTLKNGDVNAYTDSAASDLLASYDNASNITRTPNGEIYEGNALQEITEKRAEQELNEYFK